MSKLPKLALYKIRSFIVLQFTIIVINFIIQLQTPWPPKK